MRRPAIFHGTHRPRRRHVVIAGMTTLTLAAATPAWAFWTATAATSTIATSQTLAAPVTVTVGSATTSSLVVTVTAGPATGPVPSSYRIQRNGIIVCSAIALGAGCTETGLTAGTQYTYTVSSLLGANWMSATSTQATGATVPATPTAPTLLAADDTGSSTSDGITNVTNPRFTGTAPVGSTVSLFDGSSTTAFATVSPVPAGGTWQSPQTTLSIGTHSITAKVTLNGLTSAASPALSITIDTTAPTMGAATAACTGTTSNGYCRGTTTVTVPSVADLGGAGIDSVTYSVTGGSSGTATLSGSTATIVFSSPDGTPTVTYTATDKAGNSSTPGTKAVASPIDNTAPTPTGIALVNNGGQSGLGTAASGDTVTLTYSDGTGSGIDGSTFCPTTWSATGSQSLSLNGQVVVTVTDNGTSDTLGVSVTSGCGGTFNFGTVNLNANYVSSTTTFSGNGSNNKSTITWNGTSQLVIMLGSASGSTNTGVSAATPSYTGSASIKDLAGNSLSTAAVNGTSSRF